MSNLTPTPHTQPAWRWIATCAGALALSACGGSSSDSVSENRGKLSTETWPKTASMTPAELQTKLAAWGDEGPWILKQAGTPACGVDVYHYQYHTVDDKGLATKASGALMVPTGTDAKCTGPRPITMLLHGTVADKTYNAADLVRSPGSYRGAGIFAAQGYIVVAPNYVGYDTSPLPYHPYLNADQQAKDVIDSLAAARALLPKVSASASDKLFLTGHSQGGYVAMATHRAMQALGMSVTAEAPSSGAYMVSTVVDDIFKGRAVYGSTIYFPMAITSYQSAYGNLYTDLSQIYNPVYAAGMANLLPSATSMTDLVAQNKVPVTALFNSTAPTVPASADPELSTIIASGTPATTPTALAPMYALGFGSSALINNTFRLEYLQDVVVNPDGASPTYSTGATPTGSKNGLRQALIRNDMRGWTPRAPVMMCGGQNDPAVPFRLAGELMAKYWNTSATAAPAGMVSALDMHSAATANDPYATLKQDFAATNGPYMTAVTAKAGPYVGQGEYHTLLQRYCYTAARKLFDTLR